MKKLFFKCVSIVLSLCVVFSVAGCDWTKDDLNDAVDNYFENYKKMGETETGAYSNFKNINVQSSYLGYGYDVINDPYMQASCVKITHPILDMSKVDTLTLVMNKVNHGQYRDIHGETIDSLYTNYSTSINVGTKLKKAFSGGIRGDFSANTTEKKYMYFYKLCYYYDSFNIHISNSIEQMREYLSDTFKNDLTTLNSTQLFSKYGTHMIREAVMGGRLEKSVTYSSNSTESEATLNTSVNTHISAYGFKMNSEAAVGANIALSNSGITATTAVRQWGGKAISLAGDLDYDTWVGSFNDSLEYATLSGLVGDDSLIGIWEFLPAGYEDKAAELENAFIQLCGDNYEQICEDFGISSWEPITTTMDKKLVWDIYGYDPNREWYDERIESEHEGWELGQLNIDGLKQYSDGYYKIISPQAFKISYNLLQDIDNLNRMPGEEDLSHIVNYDMDASKGIYFADGNITDMSEIGKGAYCIRLTYTDSATEIIKAGNCLNGKSKGSKIDLITANNIANKTLKKIEIVFVYELLYADGEDPYYRAPNWRCDLTLNFVA